MNNLKGSNHDNHTKPEISNVNDNDFNGNNKYFGDNTMFANEQNDNQEICEYSFITKIQSEHKNKYKNILQHSHVAKMAAETKKGARKLKNLSEPNTIKWAKKNAKQLKKFLRSSDVEQAKIAAKRIAKLKRFKEMKISEIIVAGVRHADCLNVIAIEKGFKDFEDLRLSALKKKMNGNV